MAIGKAKPRGKTKKAATTGRLSFWDKLTADYELTQSLYEAILFTLRVKTSIILSGLLGFALAVAFALIVFPGAMSILIPGLVGLLLGLKVAIILTLLFRKDKQITAAMRRILMKFAILLSPITIAALGLTLAASIAPFLLFAGNSVFGWLALAVISAIIGFIALAGIFALAGSAGSKTWQEYKSALRHFFKRQK